jgi:MFS family permease
MTSVLRERVDLFREKPFVLYAGGNLISVAGSGMQAIATSWLVLQLTEANLSIAFLLLCSALPGILFSPLIGIFVDRLDRKFLAASMDVFRAMVTVLLLLLWWLQLLQAWHLYLAESLISLGDLAFVPATMALLRELLSNEQLLPANATIGMLIQLGTACGTAVGGILIALYSPGAVMALNALSYLISALCILKMRRGSSAPRVQTQASGGPKALFRDLQAGVAYIRQHPTLVPLFLVLLSFTMTIAMLNVLLVAFAKDVLKVGVSGFGSINASFAIGAILGCILLPILRHWIDEKRLMVLGVAATGGCVVLFALSQNLLMAMAGYFLIGVFIETRVFYTTSTQRIVDLRYQGRVYATFTTFFSLITLVLYLGMGLLQEVLSQRALYSFQGVLLMAVAFFIARPYISRLFQKSRERSPSFVT